MSSSITVNVVDDDVSMVVHGSGGSQSMRSIHSEDGRNPVSFMSRFFRSRGLSIDLSGESNHRAELPERRAIARTPPRSWTTVEIDATELASLRLNLAAANNRLASTEKELVAAREELSHLQERVDVIPQREAELEQMRRSLYAKEAEILDRERHLNDLINEQKRRLGMMFTHLAEGGQP
jgi:septal ring factor EnvC (AmiA/AmiB activator)